MKLFRKMFRQKPVRKTSIADIESRFFRLYSEWHETRDLSLRKRLLVRLNLIMRRAPNFDLRNRFKHAF